MEDQEIFIAVVVALLAIGLFVFIRIRDARKLRVSTYKEHANRFGFLYELKPDWDVTALSFGERQQQTSFVVMQGISKTDSDKITRIFDFKRVIQSGGKTNYSWGNAIIIEFEERQTIPEFYCLRCPRIMGGVLNLFLSNLEGKFKDINFSEDKEFSDATLLMGQDEEAIRKFFASHKRVEVQKTFKLLAPMCGKLMSIAFTKNMLIIKPGQRISAPKLAAFIKKGESAVETIIS